VQPKKEADMPIVEKKIVVDSNYDGTHYTAREAVDIERTAGNAMGVGTAIGLEAFIRALVAVARAAVNSPVGATVVIIVAIFGLWFSRHDGFLPESLNGNLGGAIVLLGALAFYGYTKKIQGG
jgi:hypothetical protein